jgi:hypothetical protein
MTKTLDPARRRRYEKSCRPVTALCEGEPKLEQYTSATEITDLASFERACAEVSTLSEETAFWRGHGIGSWRLTAQVFRPVTRPGGGKESTTNALCCGISRIELQHGFRTALQ